MEGKSKLINVILALLIPIIGALLLLQKYNVGFQDISIFTTPWNDELSYYKQIQGIMSYGMPKGYFGYNESTAAVGTIGPWSPVLMIPYSIIFKLIGIGTKQIICTNIILSTLTIACVTKIFVLNIKQVMEVAIIWIGFANIVRYVFSISPELLVTLCVICMFSFIYKYKLDENKKYLYLFWVILIFLTMARGYYAIYGLVAVVLLFKKNKRGILTTIAIMFVGVILYALIMHYLCSPYFFSLINSDLIKLLFSNPFGFIKEVGSMIIAGIIQMSQYIGEAVHVEGSCVGVYYLLGIMAIALSIIDSVIEKNECLFVGALCFVIIIISMWVLYDVRTGSRHLLASELALFLLIVIIHGHIITDLLLLLVSIAIIISTWKWNSDYDIEPPITDQTLSETIADASYGIEFGDEPWDNTLIWTLSCNYNELFGVPEGVGINICMDSYVIETNDLKSKYIAIPDNNEDLVSCANSRDWEIVGISGGTLIYSTR